MLKQALIAGGGKGTKLGALAIKYGNKSLVPVNGKPTILYTVDWLMRAGVKDIVITVNYKPEYEKINQLFKDNSRVSVIRNKFRKISAQCVAPSRSFLGERFLFVYGHAPAPATHLIKLFRVAKGGAAVSLYNSTTQENPKPAMLINSNEVELVDKGHVYIEPPYILNSELVSLLKKTESWKKSFRLYSKRIKGVTANHPSEFHYPRDFRKFKLFMGKFANG